MMKSPIVLILSLQLGMTYGYLYLLFTTFTFVFEEQYQFRAGAAGLAYLGLGIGFLTSLFFLSMTSDSIAKKRAQADEDGKLEIKPESRLAPLLFGVLFVPVGLFWYGWTAQYKIHWIVPIIGTTFIGIGVNLVWIPVQSYLIDAFTIYAASAIGANTVIRSVFGVVLPLAGQPLYNKLGLGWGNSLLGFIALATVPLTWLLMKHGERIRLHPRFQFDL
jgi:MFS family permease